MPPLSGKQRKTQLKLKRAIKRGDAPPPEQPQKRKKRPRQTPPARLAADQASRNARNLQSQFVKLDKGFLDGTKALAATIVLRRPISSDVAVLRPELVSPVPSQPDRTQLTVPERPKWKYQMSKEELDANEQAYFRRWLAQQDATMEQWQHTLNAPPPADQALSSVDPAGDGVDDSETHPMPHPPTHFERNIEVWRQFWRVTEISQILLVLLDSRCPPLHLPPSLSAYLKISTSSSSQVEPNTRSKQSSRSNARVILVLTKVDISGPTRTASWTSFLNVNYPSVPVVAVEAYAAKPSTIFNQGPTQYEPHLPGSFREKLVYTLKDVHEQLLQPPPWVTVTRTGESEEERLQRIDRWRPRVRRNIDWDGLLTARGKLVGKAVGGAVAPRGEDVKTETDEMKAEGGDDYDATDSEGVGAGDASEWTEPEFLTVGLIGQPNVGKSSLLNAIFGTTRVRASRTPGKTKHFQTLLWTPDVRLVDCPGLVMPSFVPMDSQVLSGVFPISRVSAVSFCIHQIARLLPLEQILDLKHPSLISAIPASDTTERNKPISTPKSGLKSGQTDATPAEDRRTWRPGQRPLEQNNVRSAASRWTANDIMTSYAEKKGWVTAKAGRPDIHRAGNAILRLVAEGKIPWAFWPPDSSASGDDGIWLRGGMQQHAWDDFDLEEDGDGEEMSEEQESEAEAPSNEENESEARIKAVFDETEDEDEDEEKPIVRGGNLGRFGALRIDDHDS